jgi:hypothetical protein
VKSVENSTDDPESVVVVLEPRIISISPALKTPIAALGAGEQVSNLIGLGLTVALRDALPIRIPIQKSFSYSTAMYDNFAVKVDNGAELKFSITSAGESLSSSLNYHAIVTENGLWALATQSMSGEQVNIDLGEEITAEQRKNLRSLKDSLVPKLALFRPPLQRDVAFHLSSKILTGLADKYNNIELGKRVINLQSTSVSGNLYEDRWRDNILGDGGVFISLTNPSAARAEAQIGNVSAPWQATSRTFVISVPLRIEAKVDIHIHVDPLVGGGAGTSIGMVGSTSYDINATAAFRKISAKGQEELFLVPDIPCQNLPLTIRTDGVLKIGPLSTEVPSIGANFYTVLGKKGLSPISVVDSIPRRFRLNPASAFDDPSKAPPVRHSSGADGMQLAFSELDIQSDPNGVWLSANVNATLMKLSDTAQAPLSSRDLTESAREILDVQRPACEQNSRVEFLVGGIKVGPNNEFVKVFRVVGKALDDTRKVAEKALEDSRKAVEKAAEDARKEAERAADNLRRSSLNPGNWKW